MAAKTEMLNSSLDSSELLDIENELNFLKKRLKEKIEPSVIEAPHEENWAIIFKFEKNWKIRQIRTKKEWKDSYNVRVNEFGFIDSIWRNDWKKLGEDSFAANDNDSFNIWLWSILDNLIGKNREKFPKTGKVVYSMLNKWDKQKKLNWNNSGLQGWNKENLSSNESKLESKVKKDLKYEKNYGVSLIRDWKLKFYIVKNWEWLGIIKQKLSKIPEFSYLSQSDYNVPSNWTRNIHWFNTPNTSLVPWFYLPIPLKREEREISDSKFKSCAKKAIDQMENNSNYGDKVKKLLKNVKKNDVANIMAAFARSESSDDYKTFSSKIWSAELHRWEPRYKAYSFSYFHILMGEWPWMNARKKLWLTEWDCYDATNACKLFLWYCFEKKPNEPSYFFKINNKNEAEKVWKTYNWSSIYGDKLWANIEYCKNK